MLSEGQQDAVEDLRRQLNKLHEKKNELKNKLEQLHNEKRETRQEANAEQNRSRVSVLEEANVVCATLDGSGSELLSLVKSGFHSVIIDEAAQAVESANMVPLQYNCKRCVLVGDPKQLPATVISEMAQLYSYEKSLFERFQSAGVPAHLLSVQYRMHPKIAEFPSHHFYDSQLKSSNSVHDYHRTFYRFRWFQPLVFFDLVGSKETRVKGSYSLCNILEAKFVVRLAQKLLYSGAPDIKAKHVSIVTPYAQQLREIRSQLKKLHPKLEVSVHTVDGFQGREGDVVILSCVRAHSSNQNIGFLADIRRMNVALTRARFSLLVVGNAASLEGNRHWVSFVEYAKTHDCYISVASLSDIDRFASAPVSQEEPPLSKGNELPSSSQPALPHHSANKPSSVDGAEGSARRSRSRSPSYQEHLHRRRHRADRQRHRPFSSSTSHHSSADSRRNHHKSSSSSADFKERRRRSQGSNHQKRRMRDDDSFQGKHEREDDDRRKRSKPYHFSRG